MFPSAQTPAGNSLQLWPKERIESVTYNQVIDLD